MENNLSNLASEISFGDVPKSPNEDLLSICDEILSNPQAYQLLAVSLAKELKAKLTG